MTDLVAIIKPYIIDEMRCNINLLVTFNMKLKIKVRLY
jgi:hypothetical protein